jgi:hypothetical protein
MPYIVEIPENAPWAYVVKVKILAPTDKLCARLKAYVHDLALTVPRNNNPIPTQAMEVAAQAVAALNGAGDTQRNLEIRIGSIGFCPVDDAYYVAVTTRDATQPE